MGKRATREAMLAKRAEIARLAVFGRPTQQEIADKLGCDISTVSRHLKSLREEWKTQAQTDVAQIIDQELAKLDTLEAEAIEQWEKSKKDWQKRVIEDKPGGRTGGGRSAKVETGGQCGDPRYLNTVLSIQERRAKLLGLDKPSKVAATNPEGDSAAATPVIVALPPQMSVDEWAAQFQPKPGV